MALNDCFTSLQTGVIDGMIGSGAEGYYSSYRDVAKYYLPYNDHFEVWYLYINMDKWNEMSKNSRKYYRQQQIIWKTKDGKKRRPRQKNMNRS